MAIFWPLARRACSVPMVTNPGQSMVLTVHADPPMAWIATFYPRDLAFVSLVSGIESPALAQRIKGMLAARKGPIYLMLSDSGAEGGGGEGCPDARENTVFQTCWPRL